MAILKMSLLVVLKRFPAFEANIRRLHREGDTFQTICEDYAECSDAPQRWSRSQAGQASARKREYANLLQDLEAEILGYLGASGFYKRR